MQIMGQNLEKIIEKRLEPKRFDHSIKVAKSAVELAKHYGEDEQKAYVCGILHDVMKNASDEEQLEIIEKSGEKMTQLERVNKKLWHAISGAGYIKIVLKITDEEIISAVRCHTTAKANMTTLEKILYIADYISEDRDFDGVDDMRKKAFSNIDEAVLEGTRFSIETLAKRGMPIHPNTVEAYNEMCAKLI